ncbi:MAG: peptide-modifying radical SAM enzyme CbpB [bacterium]
MKISSETKEVAASGGHFLNTGNGQSLQIIDIQHPVYMAAIQPDTAFWTLIEKDYLAQAIGEGKVLSKLKSYSREMDNEIETLRFGLKPSAVYFNPTEQCNLNCTYCYIPAEIRKNGQGMSWEKMKDSLQLLKDYFTRTIPPERKPQIVFHGSEPLLNKETVFRAIEEYTRDFEFGIQTNATLLEDQDLNFLSFHKVVIGISLDGHTSLIADRCRKDWAGNGIFKKVVKVLEMCQGYPLFNVICTITNENVKSLVKIVEFFHKHKVENCLLNQVRCTLEGGRNAKPSDISMARMFIKALDRTFELYQETGHKIIVANFANIMLSIIAPSARRLMCDINPCGGGRCFFAVSAEGDVYPCSEFIGLSKFKGGNLFKDNLSTILKSEPFNLVTNRKVEEIVPCKNCAIRHFCGAPCPAEAFQLHGGMENPGAFCEFYEHQVRYAFRLIADQKESAYLWDNWGKDTKEVFRF